MKTNSKKTTLMVGAMAVMVSANVQAGVIWSEDFSNDTVGINNNNPPVTQDFTNNQVRDWTITATANSPRVLTAVDLGGSGASFRVGRINDTTGALGRGEVFMTQFAPFNTSNSSQSIFQISFDLRVDSYGGNVAAATPRVIVKPTTGTTNALGARQPPWPSPLPIPPTVSPLSRATRVVTRSTLTISPSSSLGRRRAC